MDREEEILKIVQEIRDEQAKHNARWEEAIQQNEEYRKKVNRDVAKVKRKSFLIIGGLLVLLLGIFYLPVIMRYLQFRRDFPVIDYPADTVDTAGFDGEYVLDAERSFANLYSEFPRKTDEEKQEFQQMLAEQYDNFRISNGVIRSGKRVIQEFRIISASINDGVLEGEALWHEDIYDPGDCCMMKVRLELKGDELEFSCSVENEEPFDKSFFRKKKN